MLKKLSRIFGISGSVLTMLLCINHIADCINVIVSSEPGINNEGAGLAGVLLLVCYGPALLFSIMGLAGSLLARKKPVSGAVLMLVSGVLMFFIGLILWWLVILSVLLIAAGVLALMSAKNASGSWPQRPAAEG